MWFKTHLKNNVSVNKDGNIKNSTIINNNDKLNDIYLIVGRIEGMLSSIQSELKYIHNQIDHLSEEQSKLKNRLYNLENNYYRNGRRY